MASIVAAVEAALTRMTPTHKVSFYQLVPYLLDPTPEHVIRLETPAGISKATLTHLTPEHTIQHLQCAYRARQLVSYLGDNNVRVPPGFEQALSDDLHSYDYMCGHFDEFIKPCMSECGIPVDAVDKHPTNFSDTFAVQVHVPADSDQHVLLGTTTLGQLGLASNTSLTLIVTIRPDRANFDAARKTSLSTAQQLADLNKDILIRGNLLSATSSYNTTIPPNLQHDRPLMYEMVRVNGRNYKRMPRCFQDDREFALWALKHKAVAFRTLPDTLRADYDLALRAVRTDGYNFGHVSTKLQGDLIIAFAAVNRSNTVFTDMPSTLRGNHMIAIAAVSKGDRLAHVPVESRTRDVVLAAVRTTGCALQYAPEALRNDRDIVLAAVQTHGSALEYAPHHLRNDRDIVLAAVQNYGRALKYAPHHLQNDRNIVLTAVQDQGYALEYASHRLQNDRDIVLAAVQTHGFALEYASHRLQNDRNIVLAAVIESTCAMFYASDALQTDPFLTSIYRSPSLTRG